MIRLNVRRLERSPQVIDPGETTAVTTRGADAAKTVTTYTGTTIGPQHELEAVATLEDQPAGPGVSYAAAPGSAAAVAADGAATRTGDGPAAALVAFGGRSLEVELPNSPRAVGASVSTAWAADPPTMDHVLILHDPADPDSAAYLDYYLAKRPGAARAGVLAVDLGGSSGSTDADAATLEGVRQQVAGWIAANPSRAVRYVLALHLPVRETSGYGAPFSLSADTVIGGAAIPGAIPRATTGAYARFPELLNRGFLDAGPVAWCGLSGVYYDQTGAYTVDQFPRVRLACHLSFFTVADFRAYVDKLAARWRGDDVIAGPGGGTYYVEDPGPAARAPTFRDSFWLRDAVANPLAAAGAAVQYVHDHPADRVVTVDNPAAVVHFGYNGQLPYDYDVRNFRLTGAADWWQIETVESFNGTASGMGFQGHWRRWFSPGTWGGSGYERTPVLAVAHTDEPGASGINSPLYQLLWQSGRLGIECAWASRRTPRFLCVCDPLIKR